MADILLFQTDRRAYLTLIQALETRHRCHGIRHLSQIAPQLSRTPAGGFVLDVFHPSASIPLPHLRRLRRDHPSLALIVASDFSQHPLALFHLGMEGVGGIIRLEENPKSREILQVVDRALASALAERIVRDLALHSPAFAQHAIRWSIENSESRPTAREMAGALGLSPGSLRRKLGAMELPPPRVLLLWGRLIQATHLLERDRETVENVAFRLGYSTVGALRKAIKGHLGYSPTVLLEKGGLAWTLEVFQREVLRT